MHMAHIYMLFQKLQSGGKKTQERVRAKGETKSPEYPKNIALLLLIISFPRRWRRDRGVPCWAHPSCIAIWPCLNPSLSLVKSKPCGRLAYSFLGWSFGDWLASVTTMILDFAAFVGTDWNSGLIVGCYQPWTFKKLRSWHPVPSLHDK